MVRQRPILWLTFLASALLPAVAGSTEIYRWVDEDGSVHFGDRPPEGRQTEKVEVLAPMGALPLPDAEEILRRPVRPQADIRPAGAPEPEPVAPPPEQ
jgi:hypothetical protein